MALLISFWSHFGVLLGGFLVHFEVMLSAKIGLEASWTLHSSETSISTVRLRPFRRVFGVSWGGFWRYFGIFFGYRCQYKILYDFKMIFDGI